jgi:hypothetical protein
MVGSAGYGWWDDDESFKDTATLPGLKDIQFVFDVLQDFKGTSKFQNTLRQMVLYVPRCGR